MGIRSPRNPGGSLSGALRFGRSQCKARDFRSHGWMDFLRAGIHLCQDPRVLGLGCQKRPCHGERLKVFQILVNYNFVLDITIFVRY